MPSFTLEVLLRKILWASNNKYYYAIQILVSKVISYIPFHLVVTETLPRKQGMHYYSYLPDTSGSLMETETHTLAVTVTLCAVLVHPSVEQSSQLLGLHLDEASQLQ